ncbi:MAG: hypothetical protein BAJALOKI3v1_470027 [Promethearchaeota archaeon]|nr:MAG: hypothetical protein BAJALOKI3v1_470027 [Candidatus Lokiarchaeota archaeon]
MKIKKLFKSSVIKGFVYCVHDKIGPQPKYIWPQAVPDENENKEQPMKDGLLRLSYQSYMQIAIKNLSLLLSDGMFPSEEDEKLTRYFAIIPYPDFNLTSLTYFHFLNLKEREKPIETAFSLLIKENRRNFLYNNHLRIKTLISDFFESLDKNFSNGFLPQEKLEKDFYGLLEKLIEIENQPSTPATTQRKMKIILAGLDDSGKTSFIFTVDRKFSKLMGLDPTKGANVQSIQALGASLFLWDLGGQTRFRKKYLSKSQIYIYESDLIFYFIDIRNEQRFNESLEYFRNIYEILEKELEQDTPIIFIFSKGDPDILNDRQVQKNLKRLKSELKEIVRDKLEFYITSIFQIESVLRAFSAGISKLSPNREIIDLNLKQFSKATKSYIMLLLSNEGLVLADYYSKKAKNFLNHQGSKEIIQDVFEITAPQFTQLFEIFYKFKALRKNEASFDLEDSIIIIKQLKLFENNIYVLFLIDKREKKEKINSLMPKFIERMRDLLATYII